MLSHNQIVEKRMNGRLTFWYRHNGELLPAHKNNYGGYSLVPNQSVKTAKLEEKILEKKVSNDTKIASKEAKVKEKEHADEMLERQTKISAAIAKALRATARKSAGLRKQA
jgi:hypothetical protein